MTEPTEQEVKEALKTFAEVFLQNMHESGDQTSEPFEAYELALRADIHRNSEQFKQRFIRGYLALTKED